jgi:tripartite-type tricarboxylate transporter receptor subunit TctC
MSMLPRCRRGALRALGVTTRERSPAAPELATIAETGVPDYDVANWLGVVAPKATPSSRVEELSRAIRSALQSEEVVRVFGNAGVTACGSTPDAFRDFISRDMARWRPIVQQIRRVRHEVASSQSSSQ